MKALFFDGNVSLRDIPVPNPQEGEALIRVLLAGICKTDTEITHGYMNFTGVLGHEFVGVVEDARDLGLVGTRVVGEINAGCGQCESCAKGLTRHCSHRTVLGIQGRHGAFAEYLTLPEANLVIVPDTVSNEQAVFTEPVAAALEILEQVHIEPSDRVLVIGDGKLGLLIASVLNLVGCDLCLAGKHPEKMVVFQAQGGNVILLEKLLAGSERFDKVIEASGRPAGWELALARVKPRGTIILKSTYHESISFNPALLVINEITLVGSRCGLFPPALRLLEKGLIDPTPLISAVYPLADGIEAFERTAQPGVFKVLLAIGQ